MNKSIFSAAALAFALGLSAMPLTAAAEDTQFMKMADVDKDGMVSRQEYLDAVAKIYDEKVAKMKKMAPAEMAKMMKGDLLTPAGVKAMNFDFYQGH
jgi:hypothetical protein